mmetsp:Transcript_8845/g.18307  ORF Transcript_8845/g.18307 Transcript_8845/m.18307 type:complete len:202 (-) Transcript_8845:340-945(-)
MVKTFRMPWPVSNSMRFRSSLSSTSAFGRVAASLPYLRPPQLLCRMWELDAIAINEKRGPELIRHGRMHDRAVSVTLNVGFKPLARIAPANAAHLAAWQRPPPEALQLLPHSIRISGRHHVHECVAKSRFPRKVVGKVHEVIAGCKPVGIEELQQHVTCVIIRQVPQHHGRQSGVAAGIGRGSVCILARVPWGFLEELFGR